MRSLGHVLMWLGFLAAAFVTTRQLDAVEWPVYAGALVVGVCGVALLRRTASARATHADTVRANVATLESSMARLVERLAAMNRAKEATWVYDVHGRIDTELEDDLAAFAEARESMIHALGLQQYADVMDRFARAERAIHRAWSASADGYIDEVWSCLEAAEGTMREADDILRRHVGRAA